MLNFIFLGYLTVIALELSKMRQVQEKQKHMLESILQKKNRGK